MSIKYGLMRYHGRTWQPGRRKGSQAWAKESETAPIVGSPTRTPSYTTVRYMQRTSSDPCGVHVSFSVSSFLWAMLSFILWAIFLWSPWPLWLLQSYLPLFCGHTPIFLGPVHVIWALSVYNAKGLSGTWYGSFTWGLVSGEFRF